MASPFFQSRLWQGIGRVRRTGCVPMWWHRSITFPIDKRNNKVGCNAVRLVNAFSPDSKAFYSYLWRRQPQTQHRAHASGCTAHRSRLESIAQSVNVAERLREARISFVTTNYDVANAHPSPSHPSLGGLGGHTTGGHGTPKTTSGCTTNVLTNGPITCEPNCCKRRSFLNHLLRPQIFSIRLFYGTHNLRRRCACHLDHHGPFPHIVKSDGEQCCPGQRGG